MPLRERMDPEDRPFLLATDVAWTVVELVPLRQALEVVGPIGDQDVRVVEAADRDVSTLLVGLGPHFGPFLDLVDSDVGHRFTEPLARALRGHARRPGVALHRVTLTGILEPDVEVALIAEEEDAGEVAAAVEAWPEAMEPVAAMLDRNGPENVRTVEMVWTPAVDAWILHELWLVNGEVIPGPVIEA